MGLFNASQVDQINEVARKSNQSLSNQKPLSKSVNSELNAMMKKVIDYFPDSPAVLIESPDSLHDYIDKCIEYGYAGIDTETTGLDRIKDYIVGASLYVPGSPECYIPSKHLIPIFDQPYKNQLTYEEIHVEFQRLVDNNVKLIFANADFDLAMINKDIKVDLCDCCYYDVISAWRCLKENELDNRLKVLYNKYVLKGKGEPMKFNDFFSVELFPYCKPEVAKLYAANDAKITFELFLWQLPYVLKDNKKCQDNNLSKIADLVWNIEIPMIKVCQHMHRTGIYMDKDTSDILITRYHSMMDTERNKLSSMVQDKLDNFIAPYTNKPPFRTGKDFNPDSPVHVKYLVYMILNVPKQEGGKDSTGKEVLSQIDDAVVKQILKVRSLGVLINTFVDKLPNSVGPDGRIHAQFKSMGADTGRMSSADPNMQNIPSHATDIRHMFRATPGYVMLSSDYSSQEPRITAFVAQDPKMIASFQEGKDIYASIASIAFNVPYEKCLEFHPETGEYQPDGKKRRGEAKTIVLGICYGRSVVTIADQLFGDDSSISDEDKIKKAQFVYDSVLDSFPNLRKLMNSAQAYATKHGYVETILGRRRHISDMQLPMFDFKPMDGYINPDVDPLDPSTLHNAGKIPQRIIDKLTEEFQSYKYYGQIARRTKELYEEHIRVINNRSKIQDASRKCVNSVIQGSAAEQTKMAILKIENNQEWKDIGGRILVPVHDEIVAEVPIENWKRGGEILSSLMCEAANFLPYPSKCDVTTTLRWYGLEYPCKYKQPTVFTSLEDLDEDEVKWIQYCLVELEYILPVFNDENGDKPRGDAAYGVNGIVTDELKSCLSSYMSKYKVSFDTLIDRLYNKVFYNK